MPEMSAIRIWFDDHVLMSLTIALRRLWYRAMGIKLKAFKCASPDDPIHKIEKKVCGERGISKRRFWKNFNNDFKAIEKAMRAKAMDGFSHAPS